MSNEAIKKIIKKNPKNKKELMECKRRAAREDGVEINKNSEILKVYKQLLSRGVIARNIGLEKILRKRSIRTLSGVAPVAVLTKNYPCPGECVYCPDEKNVPKSYLSNEPAVMRAIRNKYDPYRQVQLRLKALENNGHFPTKIELIVIGGTWSVLPEKYKYWYIKECFRAACDYPLDKDKRDLDCKNYSKKTKKVLLEELRKQQKKNEGAEYKIIGVTLETRPDFINEKELWQMRVLGATRVELGVQAVDNRVLSLNRRGHDLEATIKATQMLRDYGFKITYHIMPGLPGSSYRKDLDMFKKLFEEASFKPDQIKFYPTVVTKGSLLYRWWKQGRYKPYSDKRLQELIVECKKFIPYYTRVIRLIRDIPGESIEAGNKITNLRQVMKDKGVFCSCIRCREVRDGAVDPLSLELFVFEYEAGQGKELFLSYESFDRSSLYGFLRLRLPFDKKNNIFGCKKTALIRELHVYGELVGVGEKSRKRPQHRGLGRKLIVEAEKIASKNKYENMAIISGVGVRPYYRKLGYRLKNTYMIKKLS